MLIHKKPAWVYQGKTINQVVEELSTFENPGREVFLSVDYGDSMAPIGAIKNKDGRYLLLVCKKQNSIEQVGCSRMTISDLVKKLQSKGRQDLEVRLSLDFDENHKPISIIVKKDNFCLLMSCSDFYDRELTLTR